jgi:hypothetical protein
VAVVERIALLSGVFKVKKRRHKNVVVLSDSAAPGFEG